VPAAQLRTRHPSAAPLTYTLGRYVNRATYDEDLILGNYICRHYRSLMTEIEQNAEMTFLVQAKAATMEQGAPVRVRMENHVSRANEPEVASLLSLGIGAFRHSVAERILRQHGQEVFVNRCSHCHRIVQSPKAHQCLWCGHSWHAAP
jgi:hypothetical protein